MNYTPLPRVRTKAELRKIVTEWRQSGDRIGFVPTMGAIHSGHLSLVARALEECDRVIVSIFVNPKQFAAGEDLDTYPRTEDEDCAKLQAAGCHLAYCPSVEEMYPVGSATNVYVEDMSDLLDGGPRPHFFYGVSTVVARLFIHVRPDVAVFGEKDYQQLQIIKRMVHDLAFEIDIIGGKIVRDMDGLAKSSRNVYLTAVERRQANTLYQALHRASCRIEAGGEIEKILKEARAYLRNSGFRKVDYVTTADPQNLRALTSKYAESGVEGRILGAAWIGKTRLIDNIGFCRTHNKG